MKQHRRLTLIQGGEAAALEKDKKAWQDCSGSSTICAWLWSRMWQTRGMASSRYSSRGSKHACRSWAPNTAACTLSNFLHMTLIQITQQTLLLVCRSTYLHVFIAQGMDFLILYNQARLCICNWSARL